MFRQKTGIPQGSKISSLLCSFFYAVLEKDHLGFVNEACTVSCTAPREVEECPADTLAPASIYR